MNKPIKPEITIPESFAINGKKTDFDNKKIENGFDDLKPDVLAGDNLNKFIDDTYKGLNYGMAAADAINLINEGETLTVVDGKLQSGASGGGLEIGDIGIAPLGIDETKGKRRYLNGQVIIQEQYVQFTNKVKSAVALYPSLACTEEEWQTTATMTVGGQVGKFVVDDNAGTIRLPKIIMPIQGLTDLSKLAEIVEAGLPDHTHSYTFKMCEDPSGTGKITYGSNTAGADQTLKTNGVNNNSIYGNSDTVQQEQIQYPYFIQVATGAETEDNIINEIELNNPFSLLDYKYSEYELNNISWLRSQGQYNSKAVYPAVYDLLLKIYNKIETKAGVSVKLSTGSYTDYDFVLNTAEETFRLPIKVKQKFFSGDVPVVGNGNSLGLIDGSGKTFNLSNNANPGYFYPCNAVGGFKTPLGSAVSEVNAQAPVTFGVTTDSSKSGLVAKLGRTEVTGLYLYFYVGETIQNANLINAGRIEEIVATRTDKVQASLASMPSNKFVALTLGASTSAYTAPADGWFSLGGLDSIGAVSNYGFVMRRNDRFGLESRIGATAMTTGWCNGILAVKKGDVVNIYHNMTVSDSQLRFYYNQGEI